MADIGMYKQVNPVIFVSFNQKSRKNKLSAFKDQSSKDSSYVKDGGFETLAEEFKAKEASLREEVLLLKK